MADVMAQTPPLLQGPSEKERKYDRQLRLWAASGQAALESCNILLVNSGAGTVGVETLKNLVLPGIGQFTIADDAVVQDSDLGINFFLDESCRGKSRAECCADLLVELNPDVRGDWWPKDKDSQRFEDLLNGPQIFSMILYSLPIDPARLSLIESYSRQHHTPLMAVHSAGFYSYFQVFLPGAFPIVDTHPDDTATTDLRLLAPWPELVEFSKGMTSNINGLNDHEHGHLPLVVILLHLLDQWKATHDGAYPVSYSDKTAFRNTVTEAMRKDNPEGGEENFEEAVGAVMKHVAVPSLPGSLKEVFDYKHHDQEEIKSSFWIITEATKEFYKNHQVLPVPGGLPDMKAQSDVYIKLQNIYKAKARQDAQEVLQTVRQLAPDRDIDPTEVELFCTNARFIKLINSAEGRSPNLAQVVERELGNDEIAAFAGPEMPFSLIPIYLALSATSHAETLSASQIMTSVGERVPAVAQNARMAQTAEEVARAAGGELHNVSAVTGGMVAQEMIKIITKQYIPIENTCIFDGIESRCQVLRL